MNRAINRVGPGSRGRRLHHDHFPSYITHRGVLYPSGPDLVQRRDCTCPPVTPSRGAVYLRRLARRSPFLVRNASNEIMARV